MCNVDGNALNRRSHSARIWWIWNTRNILQTNDWLICTIKLPNRSRYIFFYLSISLSISFFCSDEHSTLHCNWNENSSAQRIDRLLYICQFYPVFACVCFILFACISILPFVLILGGKTRHVLSFLSIGWEKANENPNRQYERCLYIPNAKCYMSNILMMYDFVRQNSKTVPTWHPIKYQSRSIVILNNAALSLSRSLHIEANSSLNLTSLAQAQAAHTTLLIRLYVYQNSVSHRFHRIIVLKSG